MPSLISARTAIPLIPILASAPPTYAKVDLAVGWDYGSSGSKFSKFPTVHQFDDFRRLEMKYACVATICGLVLAAPSVRADQVIGDDLIVIGGACIGLDCVNGEVFGDDQLIIKENNTRIAFGSDESFRLTANQSKNGGTSAFILDTRVDVSNTNVSASTFDATLPNTGITELADGSLRVDLAASSLSLQLEDPLLDEFTDLNVEPLPGQVVIIPAGKWTAVRAAFYSIDATPVTEESGAGFSYAGDGAAQNLSFAGDGNGVTLGRGSEVVDGAVSVGADGAKRQIKQVADAVEDDDLVNMRQFRSRTGVTPSALEADTAAALAQNDAILDTFGRADGMLAMTAASSALQPNPRAQNPLSFALGIGSYKNEAAVAAGLIWRIDEAMFFRLSVAGTSRTTSQTSLAISISW